MVVNMREIGFKTHVKEKVSKDILTETHTMVNLNMVEPMEKESTHGATEKFSTVNGIKV